VSTVDPAQSLAGINLLTRNLDSFVVIPPFLGAYPGGNAVSSRLKCILRASLSMAHLNSFDRATNTWERPRGCSGLSKTHFSTLSKGAQATVYPGSTTDLLLHKAVSCIIQRRDQYECSHMISTRLLTRLKSPYLGGIHVFGVIQGHIGVLYPYIR